MIDNLRPLTQEQCQTARQAARQAVIRLYWLHHTSVRKQAKTPFDLDRHVRQLAGMYIML
jgi:hypothetical protein